MRHGAAALCGSSSCGKTGRLYSTARSSITRTKWSAETRSWSEAQSKAKQLEKDLEDLAQGKTVPKGMSVEAAINEWLEFREKNGLTNTKPKLMGQKLID